MANALVTGGAGFIGSHIVDALLAQGHIVYAYDNLSTGKKENVAPQATLIEGDIREAQLKHVCLDLKPELVVHCAAQMSVRLSMEDPVFDADINVNGVVNLLQTIRELNNGAHLVFLSTGGAIYGEQKTFPADESHPLNPESIYGLSKYAGELYVNFWARSFNVPACTLRLGNVYGPRQSPDGEAGVVAIFSKLLLSGNTPIVNGSGEQTRDFVYVKDVAAAVGSVVKNRTQGIFNIGTGLETSINTLYKAIARSVGSDLQPTYGPAKAGEQLRSCISSELAATSFAWRPQVSLQGGIDETVGWFRTAR
jgi:UDP-glucose 4-epimerase